MRFSHIKSIIFLFIINLFSSDINSQSYIGGLAGINISNVKFSNGKETLIKTSYFTGLSSDFTIKNKWRIETNLTLSKRGYKNKNGLRYKITFNYIDLQALIKYKTLSKFCIVGGAGSAFLASVKSLPRNPLIEPNNNNFDFHLDLGLEYELIQNISIHLIYLHGLLGDIQNRNLQCGLLIKFELQNRNN